MPPERKQGKSGQWYERTAEGWVPIAQPGPTREAAAKLTPPTSGRARDFVKGAALGLYNAFDAGPKPEDFEAAGLRPLPMRDPVREAITGISAADPENPTRALAAGTGVGGATAALPYTVATAGAGAPMVLASLAGGAGGALADEEARRRGAGPLLRAGAGLVGDVASGGLARGGMALGGLARRSVSPSTRAGAYVRDLELGPESADDVALAARDDFAIGKEDVDKAWDAYRVVPTQATASAEPFHRLAASQAAETALKPSDLPEIARRVPGTFGDEVSVPEIQRLQSSVSSTLADEATTPNARRLAAQFKGAANEALDEIEAASPADSQAVKALRSARKASREFGEAYPDDSALYRAFIGPKALDEPQEAFTRLLASKNRNREMTLLVRSVKGNKEALRGVRRAMVQVVLGDTAEVASASPTTALRRLEKYESAARIAWGDDGYEHFRKLLSEQATANRKSGWLWRHLAPTGSGMRGAAVGTMVGGQLAGAEGANVGFVAGGALDVLASRLSPRAVREIAVRSVYDPELYRQVARPAPKGVKGGEWLSLMLGSLVRRGIISQEEASGDGQASGDRATTTRSGLPR